MKVLILARGCPNTQDPAYGTFEYEQAVALSKKGVNVVYTYIDRRRKAGCKRIRGISFKSGYPFPVYGGFLFPIPLKPFTRISTWIYKRRFLRLFEMVVEKEGMPDLIHCHYLFNLPCAKAIKDKFNIKIVETEHWSEVNTLQPRKHIRILSSYYQYADRIVAVSDALRKAMKRNFDVESIRIFNMVSDSYFETIYHLKKDNGNKVRFVSVGYLRYLKGFDLLIEAFGALNSNREWELTICGDGAEMSQLKRLIQDKGLENKVLLLGRKNKDELRGILKSSNVFVLASRSETFGVVYIEAMACGLPVIATRCGGPEEFVTSDVGRLIDKDDVYGLKDALAYMIDHCSEYDATHIAQKCYKMFSAERIASEYIEVYNQLVK